MTIQDERSDDDEYVCEACDTTFESEEALKRHVYDMGLLN
jgi:hypothetical protein